MINSSIYCNPSFPEWLDRTNPVQGDLFGISCKEIQDEFKKTLGIPINKTVIAVGHQPNIFHPGVASKFFAASALARSIDGVVVHLVVDHHSGDVGCVEVPEIHNGIIQIQKTRLANTLAGIELIQQQRAEVISDCHMGQLLKKAEGENAAEQFTNAMQLLMQPYADIDYTVYSSQLLKTKFGKLVLEQMHVDSKVFLDSYNRAIYELPNSGISFLQEGEIPVWKTKNGLYPKALLLTFLSRVGLADLFIHGTGGEVYDQVMERWVKKWLDLELLNSAVISTDLVLPLGMKSIESERSQYAMPNSVSDKVRNILDLIEKAPRNSNYRKTLFKQLHQLRDANGSKPNVKSIKNSNQIAKKRDWPLYLYPHDALNELKEKIESNWSTINFETPKLV